MPVFISTYVGRCLGAAKSRSFFSMSHLHPGDDGMHYCDTSHRWIAPPEIDQHVWAAQVRAHMQEHLATMGGPAPVTETRSCVPRYPVHVGRVAAASRRPRPGTPISTGARVVAVGRPARDKATRVS
jgi:hypothetical protein